MKNWFGPTDLYAYISEWLHVNAATNGCQNIEFLKYRPQKKWISYIN